MTSQPILVVGANGKTGSRVSSRLEKLGRVVRRASRRADIPFDWETPATWAPALDGVARAYVTYYPDLAMPGALERIEGFSAEAKRSGVERLVLLSGRGERRARASEEIVRGSGVDFTLIRAAWFAQNFSEGQLRAPILEGALPMPGGDVREPIIDADDIADVAVAALTEDRHAGSLYEVTGPRLLSFAEMADTLSIAIGRPVRHVPLSFEAFHAALVGSAGSEIADILTEIARETLDGRNAHVTDGVERALGRKPRDFTDFASQAAKAGAWSEAA